MCSAEEVFAESLSVGLIAPCGMDCGLCRGHLRSKNRCPGCRREDSSKPAYCLTCKIKTCSEIATGAVSFCFECGAFPCPRLRQLDKRYRTKYGMSVVDNLRNIQEIGVDAFVSAETVKWTCPECGRLLCVHRAECAHCGRAWNPTPADSRSPRGETTC